jgi:hypothetical protein
VAHSAEAEGNRVGANSSVLLQLIEGVPRLLSCSEENSLLVPPKQHLGAATPPSDRWPKPFGSAVAQLEKLAPPLASKRDLDLRLDKRDADNDGEGRAVLIRMIRMSCSVELVVCEIEQGLSPRSQRHRMKFNQRKRGMTS